MFPIATLGALSALVASAAWGGGDFSGGFAARRHDPFQVLMMAALTGLVPLLVLTTVNGEGLPPARTVAWATLAGFAGALGLAAFYQGLLDGRTAVVAPVAAVVGALVPVAIGILEVGLPGPLRLVGFGAGLAGIWLVSSSKEALPGATPRDLRQGALAGLGFGGFLTFIAQVDSSQLFMPLIVSKGTSMVVAGGVLLTRKMPLPLPTNNGAALLSGLLDTAGNSFYLLGTQLTRLDVVAVLASFYPAVTVILGRAVLKEGVTWRQWIGVLVAVLAIALITQ